MSSVHVEKRKVIYGLMLTFGVILCSLFFGMAHVHAAESASWTELKAMKLYDVTKAESTAVTLEAAAKDADVVLLILGRVGEQLCWNTVNTVNYVNNEYQPVNTDISIKTFVLDISNTRTSVAKYKTDSNWDKVTVCSYSGDTGYYNSYIRSSGLGLSGSIALPAKGVFVKGEEQAVKTGWNKQDLSIDLDEACAKAAALKKQQETEKQPESETQKQTESETQKQPNASAQTIKKPATTTIKKLTNLKSKKLLITWAKKSGIKGYQLQYSTDKKFKKKVVTKTIAKASTTKLTAKKLTKKKTYYVRIRTYKTAKNNSKVYSSWSKVKKIKIVK